jgi:hypothetical protein
MESQKKECEMKKSVVIHEESWNTDCRHGDSEGDVGIGCASTLATMKIIRQRNGRLWKIITGGCSGGFADRYDEEEEISVEEYRAHYDSNYGL